MPPRKSNVSVVSNGADDAADTPSKAVKDGLSVDDLSLPKSMIARLAKGVLPANTQIHKDALLALHKSATVFVSYLASTANENAHSAGKKTINPQDVMTAIKDTEFEEFLPRLEAELKKYNDILCDKRNNYRRKLKEEKAAAAAGTSGEGGGGTAPTGDTTLEDTSIMTNGHDDVLPGVGEDEDRPTKKFKAEDGSALAPDADVDGFEDDYVGSERDDEDQREDGEDGDEDDEVEEDEENGVDDDPNAQLVEDSDADDLPSALHARDEALDEHGSESD